MTPETKQTILRITPLLAVWVIGGGMIGCGAAVFLRLRGVNAAGLGGALVVAFIFVGAAFCMGGGLVLFSYPYFIEKISAWVQGFVYPNAKLDAPAPMLSPIQGKIVAGRIEEAREDLLNHIAEYPGHATAYLILADLYRRNLNDLSAAQKTAESYLSGEPRVPGDDAVRLVLRAVDYLMEQCDPVTAVHLLQQETKKRCYSAFEKKSLRKRLDHITGTGSPKGNES